MTKSLFRNFREILIIWFAHLEQGNSGNNKKTKNTELKYPSWKNGNILDSIVNQVSLGRSTSHVSPKRIRYCLREFNTVGSVGPEIDSCLSQLLYGIEKVVYLRSEYKVACVKRRCSVYFQILNFMFIIELYLRRRNTFHL